MTQLGRWQLPPVHLDAALKYLGLDGLALPLNSRSFGYTAEQWRSVVLAEMPNMVASGVLVDDEIEPTLAAALRVLATPYLWADSIWYPEPEQPHCWRTVAAVTEGERAPRIVLGVQTPSEDPRRGGLLTVEVHERVTVSQVVLPTLPPASRGKQGPASAPASVFQQVEQPDDEDLGGRSLLRGSGPAQLSSGDRQVRLAVRISQLPRVRAGQLAVNKRDRYGKRRRSPIMAWFDTPEPDGRYLNVAERSGTGEQVATFIPADARELGSRLESLLNSIS